MRCRGRAERSALLHLAAWRARNPGVWSAMQVVGGASGAGAITVARRAIGRMGKGIDTKIHWLDVVNVDLEKYFSLFSIVWYAL